MTFQVATIVVFVLLGCLWMTEIHAFEATTAADASSSSFANAAPVDAMLNNNNDDEQDMEEDRNNNNNTVHNKKEQSVDAGQLLFARHRDACRRNPMWWVNETAATTTTNSDPNIILVHYEMCSHVTGAFQWLIPDPEHVWTKSNNKDNNDDDDDDKEDYDRLEYKWKTWWIENNKDTELRQCMVRKSLEHPPASTTTTNEEDKKNNSTTTSGHSIWTHCAATTTNFATSQEEYDTLVHNDHMTRPMPAGHYSNADEGDLVTVQHAWTECEAAWLFALLDCMHHESVGVPKEMPFFSSSSAFLNDAYNEGDGNEVTFLAGILQRYLPGIAHSLYLSAAMAYDYAKWYDVNTIHPRYQSIYRHELEKQAAETAAAAAKRGGPGATSGISGLPHPMQLGLRTAEYINYQTTGRWRPHALKQHADTGSIMTINVALSEPDDYEGGFFQLLSSSVLFKVPRLSAIVFFSEASHGITPVTSGQRQVFVTELWPFHHVRMGDARPDVMEFLRRQYEKSAARHHKKNDNFV